jgi:hypothetical protein
MNLSLVLKNMEVVESVLLCEGVKQFTIPQLTEDEAKLCSLFASDNYDSFVLYSDKDCSFVAKRKEFNKIGDKKYA